MQHTVRLSGILSLAFLLTACAPPFAASTLIPVDTAVALTLQSIAAAATPVPSETPAPLPTTAPDSLPRELYFRNRDGAGIWQIFRLEADGHTVQQVTFEPLNVDAYDVSPLDGRIAFVTNNQLYMVDAAGAGRRLLMDGGVVDLNNPWVNSLSSPVWSPDGQTLAYGHGGLNFINPLTGAVNKVLQNQIDTTPGFALVKELYAPNAYSADGGKLLIDIGYYEGGTYGIYLPANNALIRFQRPDGAIVCCRTDWIPDGSGVYISSPALGMHESGLYHADAATGTVTALLPGAPPDGSYNFALAAHVGADNQLYFFFNNLLEIPVEGHAPLYLVRSAPDGVTDRVQLLPDAIQSINDVLWAPDASLAILLIAPDDSDYTGGEARLIYLDGRAGLALVPYARDPRWSP